MAARHGDQLPASGQRTAGRHREGSSLGPSLVRLRADTPVAGMMSTGDDEGTDIQLGLPSGFS